MGGYPLAVELSNILQIPTTVKEKADFKSVSFTDNQDKRWFSRVVYNCIEWQKMEKYITNLWTKRGVIWND